MTLVLASLATGVALLLVAWVHAEPWQVVLWSCLSGLGGGLVFAMLANVIVDVVPHEQTGTAVGMNANIRLIGGAAGTALASTIITAQELPSGSPTEAGYEWGFVFLGLAGLGAAVAALTIPRKAMDELSDAGTTVIQPESITPSAVRLSDLALPAIDVGVGAADEPAR